MELQPGWIVRGLTPLADLATAGAFFLLVPALAARFGRQTLGNAGIVAGAYLLMCLGLALSRLMAPNPEAASVRTWAVGLSIPFAVFVVVMILMTSGLLEGSALSDLARGHPTRTGLASLAYLVLLLLFPLSLLASPAPRLAFGAGGHAALRLLCVLLVNGMILVTMAFWEWQLAGTEPMEIAVAGKILVFLVCLPVFLLFYAPPRVALLTLEPGGWSFAGLFALIAYTVGRYVF